MPKSANLSGIKSLRNYTITEAADVSGVSDRTIRKWIEHGLSAMNQERPTLVRGDALISFIKAQRETRKTSVGQEQFYCLKCRAARSPAAGLVECRTTDKRATLTAICDTCETIMHKPVAKAHVPSLAKVFDLTMCGNAKTEESVAAE